MCKRVLLIEDEHNIIQAIGFVLSRAGWTVHTHADGATAQAEVIRRAPDVVILDAMLPNRSGFDVLRDLRADPGTAALPVLMLTARGQKRERELARRAGASRYMTKPFSNDEVLDCLRELTGK